MLGLGPATVTVIGLIVGVAIVAVLVSKQADTPKVFQSVGGALAGVIGAAVSPITGNTSYTNMFGSTGNNAAGAVF